MPYSWRDDWRLPGPGDIWHPPELEDEPEYYDVDITTRRDGRRQETCHCPAYPFPHRLGGRFCYQEVYR